jgi:putative FmdB family regulatory protein
MARTVPAAIIPQPVPIYEYKCDNGHLFDVIQKMVDDPLTECQECGAPAVRVLHSPAVHFKGSGFYNTDYGKKKGGGPGSGGRDHLGAGIDHVSGGPDTRDAGSPGRVDGHEASVIHAAAQAGQETVVVWDIPRADEDSRSRDHLAVDHLDTLEPVGLDNQPCDGALLDVDAAGVELTVLIGCELIRVGEEDDVV